MDAASSSYHSNVSLAQAVVTLSADAVLVWLSAAIKPTSSSSSSFDRRCEESPPPPSSTWTRCSG
jgi:hypothetical protein